MRRVAALVAVALASASFVLPIGAGASTDPQAAEQDFVERINHLRISNGLGRLAVDAELTGVARSWAGDMAAAGRISHNRDLPGKVRHDWEKLGENVGVGASVAGLHDAFVGSPTHLRNLVDPAFTRIGVGVVITPEGAIYTAHAFMQLRSEAEPAGAPAPVATTRPTARLVWVFQQLRTLER